MMARWIVAILTGALALGGAAAAQDRLDYYAFPKNKGCYYGYKDAVYGYYCDGKPASKLRNDHLVDDLERLIRDKVREKEQAERDVIARDQ